MTSCPPDSIVSPSTDAFDALMQMQRTGNGWLLVIDEDRLCGILSLSDMLQILSLKLEFGDAEPQQRRKPEGCSGRSRDAGRQWTAKFEAPGSPERACGIRTSQNLDTIFTLF